MVDFIVCMADRKDVENGNTRSIEEFFMEYRDKFKETGVLDFISFGIRGYDDDPRALFDIREVRSWAKLLFRRFPYIFAFVNSMTVEWLFPSVVDIKITKRHAHRTDYSINPESKEAVLKRIIEANKELFKGIARNQEEYKRFLKQSLGQLGVE